jgi:SAM-dependent methyltransferase
MTEPVLDPAYWSRRLREAPPEQLHHAVFKCSLERWRRIEARHREILARTIGRADSVLDAGCGWGRLLELMPAGWQSLYCGVDLSPDFIALARSRYDRRPAVGFFVGDLRDVLPEMIPPDDPFRFDWAVAISFRPMVRRNCGDEVWARMERELRRVARKLMYLEYDPDAEASIE